jgi:hypothetical protein
LHAGNNAVQIRQQSLNDARADVTLGYKLANTGKPHRHKGKLRGCEKAIQSDKREHTDQPHGKHGFSVVP